MTASGTKLRYFQILGLTSLEEGDLQDKEIKLTSKSIGRMSGSKDPQVLEVSWFLQHIVVSFLLCNSIITTVSNLILDFTDFCTG